MPLEPEDHVMSLPVTGMIHCLVATL